MLDSISWHRPSNFTGHSRRRRVIENCRNSTPLPSQMRRAAPKTTNHGAGAHRPAGGDNDLPRQVTVPRRPSCLPTGDRQSILRAFLGRPSYFSRSSLVLTQHVPKPTSCMCRACLLCDGNFLRFILLAFLGVCFFGNNMTSATV